jgi:hypothetical protein
MQISNMYREVEDLLHLAVELLVLEPPTPAAVKMVKQAELMVAVVVELLQTLRAAQERLAL